MVGFDVREEERPLAWWAAAMTAAAGCGFALVSSAADALFLSRVGARHLGTMLALSSALLIVSLAFIGQFADRTDRGRLLSALAVLAAAGLVVLALLLPLSPSLVAALVLILGKQFGAAVDLAFFVLVADRFDARQGRRLLPLFVACNGVGVVVGAFAVSLLVDVVGAQGLLIIAAGFYVLAAVLAAGFSRASTAHAVGGSAVARKAERAKESGFGAGFRIVERSPLATRLAIVVAIAGVFSPILYYLLGAAAHHAFDSEAQMASFFGQYRGVVQVLTLATQAFIAPALVARTGVAPVLIITPLGAVAAALALASTWQLAVVAIAQASAKLLDTAVQTPAEKLVQNLLAKDIRGRVAGFLDGVAKRAGAIVGGLLASALVIWSHVLAVVTVLVALAWLAAAWALRRKFAELAVAELAARPRLADDESATDLATFVDERSIARLRAELGGERSGLAAAIVVQLGETGRLDAALELATAACEAAPAARDDLLRQLAIVLDSTRVEDPLAVVAQLDRLLELVDGPARADVVQLLGQVALDHPSPEDVAERLQRLDSDDDPAVRFSAAAARARLAGDADRLSELLDEGLDAEEHRVRQAAIAELRADVAVAARAPRVDKELFCARALGLVRGVRHLDAADIAPATLTVLGQGIKRCREQGVIAAEYVLLRSEVRRMAVRLAEIRRSGAETRQLIARLRAAALDLLGVMAQPDDAARFAQHLGDSDEEVRRAAAAGLRELGTDALEELLLAASYGRRLARNNALELLRDIRVSGEALDELIARELEILDETTARLAPLGRLEGGHLVTRRLQERIDEVAHTLFLVLEARFGEDTLGTAARRFLRARDPSARARALETLDTVLPRYLASRVLAPLDAGSHAERSARANERLGRDRAYTSDEAVRAELGGNDRICRALVVYALGSGGRAQHRNAIAAAASSAAFNLDALQLLRRITDSAESNGRAPDAPDEEDDVPRSVETMLALSQISLFADLSTRQLSELSDVVRWQTAAGDEVILAEDEPGDTMYFVLSGKVRVDVATSNGPRSLGELGPGEPFGEMALFEGRPRTATVTAVEKTRLGRIEREDFEELVEEIPGIALAICRVLSRRVRTATKKL